MNLETQSFFIGFFGDLFLQFIVHVRGNIANLKMYFQLHGILESACIAGGMMFLFMYIYLKILKLKIDLYLLFIYGGILDIIFRQFNLMKTLQYTYYTANNQFESFIWGGIPMILPYFTNFL